MTIPSPLLGAMPKRLRRLDQHRRGYPRGSEDDGADSCESLGSSCGKPDSNFNGRAEWWWLRGHRDVDGCNGWVRCCRSDLRVVGTGDIFTSSPFRLAVYRTDPNATDKTCPLRLPMKMRCAGRNGGDGLGVAACDVQSGIELLAEESSGGDDAVDESHHRVAASRADFSQ